MSEKIINGAVIGYGGAYNMGRAHLGWMKHSGITPVAACDIDPARVASAAEDYPGIRTYTDYHELLKDPNVDVVTCILPHNLHAQVNLDIVKAGKHCVSEKPFTLTVAEADACIEAAKASGVTLTVFHNRRFDADHLAMKELIQQGALGEVFHVEIGGGNYGEPQNIWRTNKALSGGNLYDWGVHFIDWLLQMVPDPIENVTGFYHKRKWHNVTNEDHTQAVVRFKTGKYADVQTTSLAAAPRPAFRILGTEGAILMPAMWKGTFQLHRVVNGETVVEEIDYKGRNYTEPGKAYYDNLEDHLKNGAPLAVTPESARRNIALIEAAERSAASRQAEPVAYEE